MKDALERRTLFWAGLLAVIVLLNAVASYHAVRIVVENDRLVNHTREVSNELTTILLLIADAETGTRGFVITGEERYLEPYNAAIGEIDRHVARLKDLTVDNPAQQQRIPKLQELIARRLNSFKTGQTVRREQGFEGIQKTIPGGRGKEDMDELRALIAEMDRTEDQLLHNRQEQSAQSERNIIVTFAFVTLLTLALIGAITVILRRNLIERRQSEALLREQKDWLAVTLTSIGDSVIASDAKGNITFINPVAEAMTGWSRAEATGKPLEQVFKIINEGTRQPVESPVAKVLREGSVVGLANHTLLISKNGKETPIDDSGAPIRKTDDGSIAGVILVFRDVTERKLLEQEREQSLVRERAARMESEAANRLKDEFLATVSHELRTPLTAILGWSAMLNKGPMNDQIVRTAMEVIERNAKAQTRIISDILDVSRIITGKLSIDPEPVDLHLIIQTAVSSIRPAADAKGVTLKVSIHDWAGVVSGDPDRLQQIVWNLLSNAVKFTPKGGEVELSLDRVDSRVEITVRDNGIGINPEFLPLVFDRFRQADASMTRRQGGLGLGLSIVRQLVELHGGVVSVESAGENKGASFTVGLPLTAIREKPRWQQTPAEPKPDLPRDTQAQPADLSGVRILVVDDEPDTREIVSRVLADYGAVVRTAASSAEAYEVFLEWKPDGLISDLGMPDEDGRALIRRIRKLPPNMGGSVPAAALTAYAGEQNRLESLAAGYDAHFSKPVEPDELAAIMKDLVKARL
jgi:PAS domain S-box-containing protein